MNSQSFIVIALVLLGYGLVSRRLMKTPFTPPMVFVLVGLILCESVTGFLIIGRQGAVVHLLGELTLIVVLFTDATRIDLGVLRRSFNIPLRMLGIGLPITILLGTLAAKWLFPSFTWLEAAILASILAPTDAALGQAVVSAPIVPVRIRQALNIESGLNDGICLPVVVILTALATGGHGEDHHWAEFVVRQVVLGPLIGLAVGAVAAKLIQLAVKSGWMSETYQKLSGLGVALLAYALAETFEGNGFIAAFLAGLVVGNLAKQVCEKLYEFGETEGQLLTLIVFLIFGTVLVWPGMRAIDWSVGLYALLSLTVVRMIPVALSLVGSGLHTSTSLFLGWFGPRGVATILFGLLVVEHADLAAETQIFNIATVTVLLSVFAHGFTAMPFANLYGKRHASSECAKKAEHQQVPELPVRGQVHFRPHQKKKTS